MTGAQAVLATSGALLAGGVVGLGVCARLLARSLHG